LITAIDTARDQKSRQFNYRCPTARSVSWGAMTALRLVTHVIRVTPLPAHQFGRPRGSRARPSRRRRAIRLREHLDGGSPSELTGGYRVVDLGEDGEVVAQPDRLQQALQELVGAGEAEPAASRGDHLFTRDEGAQPDRV